MKYFAFIALFFIKSKFLSAGVTETSFATTKDETEIMEITEVATTESTSSVGTPEVLTKENNEKVKVNESLPEEIPPWSSESSPILKALRDFLLQARDGILEPLDPVTESSADDKTEKLIKIIEQGLIEATTILLNPLEDTTFTLPSVERVKEKPPTFSKTESEIHSVIDPLNFNILSPINKRQGAANVIANATTACSSCYESLQTCVQKCFAEYNCNDIQRNVRTCPPPPSRLCNPFTQWSPVDECKIHEDCKSPQLCCSDGCINKCSPGIWSS